ncbi:MAG: ATP-binding cassette domain-containing protein [Acidimicrobiales bacterium]
MTQVAAFELRDVVVTAPDHTILDDVSVSVPADGVTALVGPSGSGKTRLLRLLNRLDLPASGTIAYRSTPLEQMDTRVLRRQVGMVFQRPPLFPGSVLQNLRVADPDLDRSAAESALARVRLRPDHLDQDARSLSGGEAQRMCFARALLTGPDVLLADEPTAGLDEEPKLALESLARSLADDGVAIVWVSHDREQVERLADHVMVLRDGTVEAP